MIAYLVSAATLIVVSLLDKEGQNANQKQKIIENADKDAARGFSFPFHPSSRLRRHVLSQKTVLGAPYGNISEPDLAVSLPQCG